MKYKKRTYKGLPVVDAHSPVELHITKADITGSDKKSPSNCAAARAGKRELKKEVHVFLTRTYVKEKNHWLRFINPQSVSREITSFDRGATFEPGTYRVVPANDSSRLGTRHHLNHTDTKTGKTKGSYHVTASVREYRKPQ